MHSCTRCPRPCQQATTNSHLCQRLLDTHGQVWVSLLWDHCSFLLGPSMHKFVSVLSKILSPQSCISPGGSMVGLRATSSKRLCDLGSCTQSPSPCSRPLMTHASAGDPNTGVAQSLWGLWVLEHARFCLSPSSIYGRYQFNSKRNFAPPTVLLGFLLCPWTLGIFFWWDPTFSCPWLFSSKL